MRKLLWIGDAGCSSGFGRASHAILKILQERWDVAVLGVNYRGDPHDHGYKIYPAWTGGDPLGLGRIKELVKKLQPELIVIQTNPWNIPTYQRRLHQEGYGHIPVVGIIAVEGKNCDGTHLNLLKKAIFWTEFGRKEAVEGGCVVPTDVVPLGVDTEFFTPGDKQEARDFIKLPDVPKDSFFVCNVNRNQNRKRIDLSMIYFAEWIKRENIRDAYLYLHLLPGSSTRVNCDQLGKYLGISDRLILAEPDDIFNGAPEEYVRAAYRASDIGLTTTLGEGWGLTTLEAASCGRQQIAGDYAAIGEWGAKVLMLVPCYSEGVMPDVHNMIGGVPDMDEVIDALNYYYYDRTQLAVDSAKCYDLARQSQFNWTNVANGFAAAIEGVIA